MSRIRKSALLMIIDCGLSLSALWAAFALKFDSLSEGFSRHPSLYVCVASVSILVGAAAGLYRTSVRFFGIRSALAATLGAVVSACVLYIMGRALTNQALGMSLVAIFALVLCGGQLGIRFLARWLLAARSGRKEPVLIYGAGEAGAQLAAALASGRKYLPVTYVDENRALCGTDIHGVPVIAPEEMPEALRKHSVTRVLLAIPGATRRRRAEVIASLVGMDVHVQLVPDLEDLAAGRARMHELREVDAADLLGRDSVPPNQLLLDACIRGKSVLVTGAGGSIGSELCRQILRQGPTRLCLLEMSEHSLYQIERELRGIAVAEQISTEIVALLGSSNQRARMREIMRSFEVQTIYHAAAYKHVPIVEHNIIDGIHNNLYSTWYTAEAALEANVETFVLISTDKAVNPTNVMGATKRMAEIVLQGLQQRSTRTRFCMVRFGNVLESSGSVVPLFREQIRRGGPVTVTHPDVVRYFMTIPEAAQLVIQAGSMGRGGDVFVLNMGQPVRIYDLARRMIQLSGLTVRDEQHPEGDIDIHFSGLRPAEKLFEELLIGKNVTGTDHPMIMRAIEHSLPWEQVEEMLGELLVILSEYDCHAAIAALQKAVQEYQSADGVQDLVWLRRRGLSSTRGVSQIMDLNSRRAQRPGAAN
jgi:FlaA1/EpsC-like NDP-sugar epimerase